MTGSLWRSAAAAALFAMHPLRVESVAWAFERKDVLCGIFWMLGHFVYAAQQRAPRAAKRIGIAACLTAARAVIEKLPLFAITGLWLVWTLLAHARTASLPEAAQLPLDLRLAKAVESGARDRGPGADSGDRDHAGAARGRRIRSRRRGEIARGAPMRLQDVASLGSGIPIQALKGDVMSLPVEDFEDRHGSAFLLLTAADLRLPRRGPDTTDVRLLEDTRAGESTASLSLVVFALRARGGAPAGLVTLGRSRRNDVEIPDVSVSRFHAFATRGPAESWRIQDAGSSNGTTVDGRNAPQRGQGEPIDLKAGSNLRLGQIELTFLDPEALRSYLARL